MPHLWQDGNLFWRREEFCQVPRQCASPIVEPGPVSERTRPCAQPPDVVSMHSRIVAAIWSSTEPVGNTQLFACLTSRELDSGRGRLGDIRGLSIGSVIFMIDPTCLIGVSAICGFLLTIFRTRTVFSR